MKHAWILYGFVMFLCLDAEMFRLTQALSFLNLILISIFWFGITFHSSTLSVSTEKV